MRLQEEIRLFAFLCAMIFSLIPHHLILCDPVVKEGECENQSDNEQCKSYFNRKLPKDFDKQFHSHNESIYLNYTLYLAQKDFTRFKHAEDYMFVLEHVGHAWGIRYLDLIFEEFPQLRFEDVRSFVEINDRVGAPNKFEIYSSKYKSIILCSPTSLRYVYHAMLILGHYQNISTYTSHGHDEMAEVGCGYGGLFLALNYFSSLVRVQIPSYHLIDLPEACDLIRYYLDQHQAIISIPYHIHSAYDYGKEIVPTAPFVAEPSTQTGQNSQGFLFFISNYCLTELDDHHRQGYREHLLPKARHGFVIWQKQFLGFHHIFEVLGLDDHISTIQRLEEERPEFHYGNAFVYY